MTTASKESLHMLCGDPSERSSDGPKHWLIFIAMRSQPRFLAGIELYHISAIRWWKRIPQGCMPARIWCQWHWIEGSREGFQRCPPSHERGHCRVPAYLHEPACLDRSPHKRRLRSRTHRSILVETVDGNFWSTEWDSIDPFVWQLHERNGKRWNTW